MINAEAQRRGDAEIALKLLIALDLTQKGWKFFNRSAIVAHL